VAFKQENMPVACLPLFPDFLFQIPVAFKQEIGSVAYLSILPDIPFILEKHLQS